MEFPVGKIAIGIATYRRPHLLAALLDSLAAGVGDNDVRVVVVDNDAAGTARETVTSFKHFDVEYILEPMPGIAEARNRFLSALTNESYVVFVDDDERVDVGWLDALLETMDRFGADVVLGPVVPEFPAGAPSWAVEGGFFERERHATGTVIDYAATNNVLVARRALLSLKRPFFSEDFSRTGGSDAELFHRMHKDGANIVWADEAVVREVVPMTRLTWTWVKQRAVRTGNVRARLLLADGLRFQVLAEGCARLLIGWCRLLWRAVSRRPQSAWSLNRFYRGCGMLSALGGRFVQEYARK